MQSKETYEVDGRETRENSWLFAVKKNCFDWSFIAILTSIRRRLKLSEFSFRVSQEIRKNLKTKTTLPYIRGTFETIARILQPYNLRVAHKPITTLRRLLTNVKDKDKPDDRQGVVYKIKCCDCQASYIGETDRNLSTRLTEHKGANRNDDVNNHIAEHHLQTKHQIDWDSATCITYYIILNECNLSWNIVKYCILSEVCMINSTVSPQMWCVKSMKGWFTHPRICFARFSKVYLSTAKNSAWFVFQEFVLQV